MNKLNPDLKRLLKWAHISSPPSQEEAPFGFAARVLASRPPAEASTLIQDLQRVASGLSWIAVAVIVLCTVVLINQGSAPAPAKEFSSALNFLTSNLPR